MSRELPVASGQLPAMTARAGSGHWPLTTGHFPRRRRGFSFTEVMFAVIILGIGFIMVAGIFPVSLQQAKTTTEEIAGAAVARAAAGFLGEAFFDNLAGGSNVPATGTLTNPSNSPLRWLHLNLPGMAPATPSWPTVAGNAVLAQEPQYAWTALYRRDGVSTNPKTWSPFAQVYIFALVSRATDLFDVRADTLPPLGAPTLLANLQPKPVLVRVANDVLEAGGMDLIAVAPVAVADYSGAAIEGAYVVIMNDAIPPASANAGRMNGRIFRLGARRVDMDSFFGITGAVVHELQPGNDFAPDPGADGVLYDPTMATTAFAQDDILGIGNTTAIAPSAVTFTGLAQAAIVGRGYENAAGNFAGTSMVVGVYTTMVNINRKGP